MIPEQLPSLTANMKLMTDTGNFRVIKNVSFISHLPTSASQSRSAYASVPFLQLVLHGIVGYSGEPLNFSENAKTSFLRCVEYGASPAYEWTYSDTYADKKNKSDEDSTDTVGVYYENWIASASGHIGFRIVDINLCTRGVFRAEPTAHFLPTAWG